MVTLHCSVPCIYHGFSQEDYEEALTHTLGDPVNALSWFTAQARKAGFL